MTKTSSFLELYCRWRNHPGTKDKPDQESDQYYEALYREIERLVYHGIRLAVKGDDKDAEEIFARLLKWFLERENNKHEAIKNFNEFMSTLSLSSKGKFYENSVKAWGNDFLAWINRTENFGSEHSFDLAAGSYEQQAKKINDERVALVSRGYKLLDWLGQEEDELDEDEELVSKNDGEESQDSEDISLFDDDGEDSDDTDFPERTRIDASLREIKRLLKKKSGEKLADDYTGIPGGAKFALSVWEIIQKSINAEIPGPGLICQQSKWGILTWWREQQGEKNRHQPAQPEGEGGDQPDGLETQIAYGADINQQRWEKAQREIEQQPSLRQVTFLLEKPLRLKEIALEDAKQKLEKLIEAGNKARQQEQEAETGLLASEAGKARDLSEAHLAECRNTVTQIARRIEKATEVVEKATTRVEKKIVQYTDWIEIYRLTTEEGLKQIEVARILFLEPSTNFDENDSNDEAIKEEKTKTKAQKAEDKAWQRYRDRQSELNKVLATLYESSAQQERVRDLARFLAMSRTREAGIVGEVVCKIDDERWLRLLKKIYLILKKPLRETETALSKLEQKQRKAETQLLKKFNGIGDLMEIRAERAELLKKAMTSEIPDAATLKSLDLTEKQVCGIRQPWLSAQTKIQTIEQLLAQQQADFERQAQASKEVFFLLMTSTEANEEEIGLYLGLGKDQDPKKAKIQDPATVREKAKAQVCKRKQQIKDALASLTD